MALVAVLTVSSVAAVAQGQQCTEDYLNETYTKWWEPYKARDTSPQQKDLAYQIAKEYANKCPNEFPDNAYAKALKSYVQVYEKAQATGKVGSDFAEAIKKLNYQDIMRTGKAYVAVDPNNSTAYLYIGLAGLNDPSLLSDAAQYAPKAIELVETGKPVDPFKTKDQALATMNYLIAKSKVSSAPADAIPFFIKAAKYQSDLQKSPLIYNELAAAYGAGPVAKYAKEYEELAKAGKSVDSPEVKLAVANLNQSVDRQIDSFARAAALSNNPTDKKAIMDVLTDVYKGRHRLETGFNERVNELVAGVLNKPIPDPPAPITALPTPTPTPTGSSSGSGSVVGGAAPPATAAPGSSSPMKPSSAAASSAPKTGGSATGAQPSTGTKPTASPTPKPRQRRNHS